MPDVCNFCGNSGERSKPCSVCTRLRKKDWRETYPERHRLYNDLKRSQTPELTEEEKIQVLGFYTMARYKTEETGVEHHVDHIIPISKGGLHKPDNLRVITAKENLMKSDKIINNVEVGQVTTEQEQVSPPNDKEIYKICKVLANKYNSPNHYDDLISEGLVACYECRESGKTRKADYVGSARRAMNDYINIKTKAVSIPSTWASRTVGSQISRGGGLEGLEGVKGGTLFQLFTAMSNDVTEVDKAQVSTKDHAESYEAVNYQEYVVSVAKRTLTEEEWEILDLRYYQDKTQHEVASLIGKGQMWVSRHERSALSKLKVELCNNL
jgi:RNA polymerase sigma factor (sigma-70 family)